MPVQLPSGLFNAYTEVLDSSPTANRYAKLMERKQAKDEAMDAYQRDRITKVNDKGLRDVDRRPFDNSLSDIYGNYTTNRQNILKGSSKEALEYETKWRIPKEILSKSQVSQATHEAAMKLYNERFKKKDVMPKGFMEELALNDLPVDDPDYKLFDLKKWIQDPPPLNMPTFLKNFSDLDREGVRYEDIPGQPLKENEIKYFAGKGLDAIRFRAANVRDEDFGFATQIEKEYEDPIGRKKMIDVFTKAYGTPPVTMDDYAAAFTIEMLQLELVKPIDKKGAIMDKAADIAFKKMEVGQGYKQANIKLAAALGLGSWKDKYQFNSEAIAAGVDKNDATAQGLVDAAKQPDGTLKLDPDVIGLPPYAANLRVDGGDIKYDVTYEGGKKETKSVTRESAQKFMSNKLDLKVVPVPQQKPKQPTGKIDLSKYDIPKGAKVKYAADGKTPIGYELNGQKFKFQ